MDYELSGKRVLVTGATGFIGRHVVPRLRAEGALVDCLTRDAARAEDLAGPGVQVTEGDLTDESCVVRAVGGAQVVVHLAGMLVEFEPVSHYRRINVEASRGLARAAFEAGVERFVHTSSGPESVSVADYFGHLARIAGRENLPRLPGWAGRTIAAAAEAAVRFTGRPPLLSRDEAKSLMCSAAYNGDRAARELHFRAGVGLDQGMASVEAWLRESGETEPAGVAGPR